MHVWLDPIIGIDKYVSMFGDNVSDLEDDDALLDLN